MFNRISRVRWEINNEDIWDLILNCPFCDNKPMVIPYGNSHNKIIGYEILCNGKCHMKSVTTGFYDDLYVAISVWNERK